MLTIYCYLRHQSLPYSFYRPVTSYLSDKYTNCHFLANCVTNDIVCVGYLLVMLSLVKKFLVSYGDDSLVL